MTYEEFSQTAKEFCATVNEFLQEHEDEVHDGEFCAQERGNLLAYVAHMIGHNGDVWLVMLECLESYTHLHDHPENHGHLH